MNYPFTILPVYSDGSTGEPYATGKLNPQAILASFTNRVRDAITQAEDHNYLTPDFHMVVAIEATIDLYPALES